MSGRAPVALLAAITCGGTPGSNCAGCSQGSAVQKIIKTFTGQSQHLLLLLFHLLKSYLISNEMLGN